MNSKTLEKKKLILAGNPNVGKSVIFGILSGRYVTVSNYPQTTIEISRGEGKIGHDLYEIIDTPGTNTLLPASEDEIVTTEILIREDADALLQVADSKNLSRALMLTLQLAELGVPMILALNMNDEAADRGIEIDSKKLSRLLGVPVTPTVAVERRGTSSLSSSIDKAAVSSYELRYPKKIEDAVMKIEKLLPTVNISSRGAALLILENNPVMTSYIRNISDAEIIEKIEDISEEVSRSYIKPLADIITEARRESVKGILKEVYFYSSDGLKRNRPLFISPFSGIPALLGVMGLVYYLVGFIGAQVLVDFIEETVFDGLINPFSERFFIAVFGDGLFSSFFIGEYGMITMALTYAIALILPIIFTFFLIFSLMEDSGYLPRLSAMLNNIFSKIGLSGKAVLPIVLGFGCTTMATMVTRILPTKKERILATFLLALGIPCSAQLGVILGVSASVSWKVTVIWFFSIALVLLIGGALAEKLVKGEKLPEFIMELPPLRVPRIGNITRKTLARVRWYLKEVVPVFIIGTAILFLLDIVGFLRGAQRFASPIVQGWLGLPVEATEAFIVGFFRRDFGAAGLFSLFQRGMLNPLQVTVSLITITLFVPCIANMLMIFKERGIKAGTAIIAAVFPAAILIGGIIRILLSVTGVF